MRTNSLSGAANAQRIANARPCLVSSNNLKLNKARAKSTAAILQKHRSLVTRPTNAVKHITSLCTGGMVAQAAKLANAVMQVSITLYFTMMYGTLFSYRRALVRSRRETAPMLAKTNGTLRSAYSSPCCSSEFSQRSPRICRAPMTA